MDKLNTTISGINTWFPSVSSLHEKEQSNENYQLIMSIIKSVYIHFSILFCFLTLFFSLNVIFYESLKENEKEKRNKSKSKMCLLVET